eukprot:CAMPEP_0177632226 /NCGR_PEP_ID=MMETSP0447-20121125/2173_1 /TAXON_ID=0 /ORGANISM="Stygamoeba regulata, Strain BSH-02190019" /LENGTH=429 /DNA_ID=CAMNT_0019133769 /DNA_START=286 /DNA_END=1575 /DNA_ORIENTATION=+
MACEQSLPQLILERYRGCCHEDVVEAVAKTLTDNQILTIADVGGPKWHSVQEKFPLGIRRFLKTLAIAPPAMQHTLATARGMDGGRLKLFVNVLEAANVFPADFNGKSDPYCILKYGGQEGRTCVRSGTLNPIWGNLFEFDIVLGEKLSLFMMDKDLVGADDPIGEIELCPDELTRGTVVDKWHDLQIVSTKKGSWSCLQHGQVHVRYYISEEPQEVSDERNFYYIDKWIGSMKTGDLIGFIGDAVLSDAITSVTNAFLSHTGMVYKLTNPETNQEDVFIVEALIAGQPDYDYFSKQPLNGINIFHIRQRLRNYVGHGIYLYPIEPGLSAAEISNLQRIVDEFKYQKKTCFDIVGMVLAGLAPLGYHPKDNVEKVYCSEFNAYCLKTIGRLAKDLPVSTCTPQQLVEQPVVKLPEGHPRIPLVIKKHGP